MDLFQVALPAPLRERLGGHVFAPGDETFFQEGRQRSVYCFGKKHRPDLTLGDDGIAVEVKFITYHGLTSAIGQGFLYRQQYKFVVLILVISEERKSIYLDLEVGKETDLEDTLRHLASEMNIFTYVVPAFNVKAGVKKCVGFFK